METTSRGRGRWFGERDTDRYYPDPVYDISVDQEGLFRVTHQFLPPRAPVRSSVRSAAVRHRGYQRAEGLFQASPPLLDIPEGPFRSFVEAAAAIHRIPGLGTATWLHSYGEKIRLEDLRIPSPGMLNYSITLKGGKYYIDPPAIGGPFESLSDVMVAVQRFTTYPRIPPMSTEFYFIMKDGLFHIHPDILSGPFSGLDDAIDAIQCYQALPDYEKEGREKMRRMREFLSKLDPADYGPCLVAPETICHPTEDKDYSTDDSESQYGDPVILEAIRLFESLTAKREAKENGLKWMKNEAIKAFKIYLSSLQIKGIKYKFVKIRRQCLISDGFPKFYHHYNFVMKIKIPFTKRWRYRRFFAEVKSIENETQYFCCPLQPTDKGACNGCCNAGIGIKHPTNGGYEQGNEYSGFPFDTDDESDE
ncbi:hypothetical protein ACP4OV_023369 [Aristida adscensionis]